MGLFQALLCTILLLCTSLLVQASTYYVSVSGSDSNAGTLVSPFKTISKCASVAATGDVCTVRAGTYRETVTVTKDGITFNNYNGESVTVSGADLISSSWTLYSGNIYKTTVTLSAKQRSSSSSIVADNAIYVDAQIMPTARWPNINYNNYIKSNFSEAYSLISAASSVTNTYYVTLTDPLLADAVTFNMANSVKCTATFALMYYTGTCIVTSGGNGATQFSIDCSGRDGFNGLDLTRSDQMPSFDNYYYLWDNLNFLDTPGEWYYDSSSSTLYAYMPDGKNPSTHTVEAWARHNTFDISNRKNIVINGINTFAGLIASSGTSYLTITNSDLKYIWHQTDLIGFNTIISNGFGIVLSGANNIVRNNTIGPTSNFALVLGSTTYSNVIDNNVVYGCGYAPFFKCIQVGANTVATGSTQNLITQNTGFYSGDMYINMMGGVDMHYNDFYQSNLQRADFGTIYSYNEQGRGAQITHNYVHDSYAPVQITKYGTKGFAGASGIYVDNGGTNIQIYRNVIWGFTSGGVHVMGQYSGNAGYPATPVTENVTYAYNTIFGFGTGSSTQSMKNVLFENNLITQGWKGTMNPGIIYTNDPTTGALDSDYRPTSGSTLLSAAVKMGSPYDNSVSGTPAVGAKDPSLSDFLPGAYVRPIDITKISISCSTVTSGKTTCTLTNIPIGRKLPLSFQMGVSSSPSSSVTCTSTYNYDSNLSTGYCTDVPVPTSGGTLYVRLYGTTAWIATSQSVASSGTTAPTTAPTKAPTQAPTKVPTSAPTKLPTVAPTPAPSANRTVIPAGSSGSIRDTNQNVWTITSGGQVAVNGQVDTATANVIELAYVSGKIWQENNQNRWWYKVVPSDTWGPFNGTPNSPLN